MKKNERWPSFWEQWNWNKFIPPKNREVNFELVRVENELSQHCSWVNDTLRLTDPASFSLPQTPVQSLSERQVTWTQRRSYSRPIRWWTPAWLVGGSYWRPETASPTAPCAQRPPDPSSPHLGAREENKENDHHEKISWDNGRKVCVLTGTRYLVRQAEGLRQFADLTQRVQILIESTDGFLYVFLICCLSGTWCSRGRVGGGKSSLKKQKNSWDSIMTTSQVPG